MKQYDLIVIGSGSGGGSVAYACKKQGWTVAVIDKQSFGGTCALRGCNPKKVLVGAAEIVDHAKRMQGLGISHETSINWNDLMKFKNTFTDSVPENSINRLLDNGIDVYQGVGRFINEKQLMVNGEILQADKFVIAAGSKPRPLQFTGSQYVQTSDDFLEMKTLPKRLVFVGGGYISFEFAHIAKKAGAEVTIIHRSKNVLKEFEQDLVDELVKISKQEGITIEVNAAIKAVKKQGDEYTIDYIDSNEKNTTLVCDAIFHGAGRIADIQELDLETAKISYNDRGVVVNEYLQSVNNPNIYASGDAADTQGLKLTTVASSQARAVTYNLLNETKVGVDYRVMPSVVFTQPKLAMLGLSEKQAISQKIATTIKTIDMTDWYTSKRTNESSVVIKLILNHNTDKIIGVHILGDNADDLINHFSMIMTFDLPFKKIVDINFAYPTSAYDLKHLLDIKTH